MNGRGLQLSESRMLESLPSSISCSGEDRVIVSDIAGTTRDAIDTDISA